MSLRNTEVIRAMAMADGVHPLWREMIPQLSDDNFMIVAARGQ